jgi:hypothetical protein
MYETEYFTLSLRKDGWHIKIENRNRYAKEIFEQLDEAENWVKKNYPDNWISHEIKKSIGHLMTFKKWKEGVKTKCFIDDDGWGDLLDENYNTIREGYSPSDYRGLKPRKAKYILWYNR